MYNRVREYMAENRMIEPGCTVLAGVSGGGDSMTMLSLLKKYQEEVPFSLYTVHVNHQIRGEEADRDEALVKRICTEWGIPCSVYQYPVSELARQWKVGTEEAGRMVRREAFEKERIRLNVSVEEVRIALAHNCNDLAETMLHHLARGCGLRGLSSMRAVSGSIIRPILCLEREEIAHYLEENQIASVLDSSNLSDEYTRNRIRHHILPLMEKEINGRAASHMAAASKLIAQAEDYLAARGEALLSHYQEDEASYLLAPSFFQAEEVLQTYAVQQAIWHLAGKRKDISAFHVQQVLEMNGHQTGRRISLPYGIYAKRTYEGVLLGKRELENRECKGKELSRQEWELFLPGKLTCPLGTFCTEIFPYTGQKIEEKKYTKWMDYDKIKNNLYVRTRRAGDFLIVNQEGNRKKINRVMIDDKIPQEKRDSFPLIVSGHEVLWMAGGRISERYKITPQTRRVLELQYQGGL